MTEDPDLVPELREGIARVRDVASQAREMLAGLTARQLNWKPGRDRWSVGQVLQHVNGTNRKYCDLIEERVRGLGGSGPRSEGPFRYGWLERWFIAQLEPPAKRRFSAPAAFRPEASEVDDSEVGALAAGLDRLEKTMRAANGLDLARVKIRSPVSPLLRLRLGAAFRVVTVHTQRHMLQARAVIEEPEYPRGENS